MLALKCQDAGVDAIVAEGFEAGGHNGREETTTLCLIPAVRKAIHVPLIAAGGIGTGRQMLAAFALGAEGVQIGTRFVCTNESSAHINFKQKVASLKEGDTQLSMKKVVPVRLVKNDFFKAINDAENRGADVGELVQILGRARAKKGMYEGDMNEGELEIGQVSALIDEIKPAADVLREIIEEFEAAKKVVSNISF
jgi:enoyl-[acyl-carrier protein] reductase II